MKQLGPKGAGAANGLSKLMTNPMEEFMIPPDEMVHLPPTPDRGYQMFWPMRTYSIVYILKNASLSLCILYMFVLLVGWLVGFCFVLLFAQSLVLVVCLFVCWLVCLFVYS
jgi:hypothetical protein